MMGRSHDTSTQYVNEPIICQKCGLDKNWCICGKLFDFMDNKFKKLQQRLWRENVVPYMNRTRISNIKLSKNLQSISGMKGVNLLKRMNKK